MINNLTIIIGSRSDVPNWHSQNLSHLISIRDPDVKTPYMAHYGILPNILPLVFEDIIDETPNSSNPDYYSGPKEKHIVEIIYYAGKIEKEIKRGKNIILGINCYAGISRSTAAAYIVLCVLAGMGKEKECFEEVLKIRDCAIPNIIMAKLADKLLDRKGELAKYAILHRKMIEDSFKAKNEQR
jgi:predicted protein tyrosine phosphatase